MYEDVVDKSNILKELKEVQKKVSPKPRKKKVDELFNIKKKKICPKGKKICNCKK